MATSVAASAALAGGLVAAVASPSVASRAAHAVGPSAAARSRGVRVDLAARAKLGRVLVDGANQTLYHFGADRVGHLACTGGCLSIWPPLLLAKGQRAAIAGKGVSGLGTVARPGGRLQVTYRGEPLYRYSGDTKAGETHGEGVAGAWHVVSVSAHAVRGATTTAPGGY